MIDCKCTTKGHCSRFGRDMTARDIQVCQCVGANASPSKTVNKQREWAGDDYALLEKEHPREETIIEPVANDAPCCGQKPSKLKQAFGLMKAAFRIDQAELPVVESRLEQCYRCDQHTLGECNACSCFVAAKAHTAGERCPLGKWDDPQSITAPVAKLYEGRAGVKPWEYRVQLVVPHINTPEPVEAAIRLWQLQTEKPFICIVDTGSTPANLDRIRALQCDNVEVHEIKGRGYRHPSAPVAVAQDVALATCQSRYQLCTHSDVFPMSQFVIEQMLLYCDINDPVVGYEMSPRDMVHGELANLWEGMVGHTLTMLHVPTIRKLGIAWNLEQVHDEFGLARVPLGNNDTEVAFNLQLSEAGIEPLLIGHDENYKRQITEHFDHCRSHASSQLYSDQMAQTTNGWIEDAIADANARANDWEDA
jgi:hypothetical protein